MLRVLQCAAIMIAKLINLMLRSVGLHISRTQRPYANVPTEFLHLYKTNLAKLRVSSGYDIFEYLYYEAGEHPEHHRDYECAFAARHLKQRKPSNILDIGSYRHFILGMLAHYDVTTIDVR